VDLESIRQRLQSLRAAFSPAQIVSLVIAFVVVVAVVVGAAWWLNTPTYRVLFADLDPESAGRVSDRLRAQKVPFQLADGGRSVLVPERQIDQLRLDFAVNGLPSTGRMGFEIFDSTQFGATEFLEQVNFRRALEGEIARTIATIAEISSARVHITMAKDRLFGDQDQPAKASVVLKLRSSRAPAAPFIAGIAALVAAAVEGLQPESVVIMDTSGRPLTTPGGDPDEPLSAAQVERQQALEQAMAKKIVALLEAPVGPGGVRANVAVRLHQDTEDQVVEEWGTTPVVRSQTIAMQGPAAPGATQGIAGARANLPGPVPPGSNEPAPPTMAAAAAPASSPIANPVSYSATTNNEVGHTTRRTSRPLGGISRLSVAVLVDDEHYVEKDKNGKAVPKTRPRPAEQIQQFHQTVAAAVGLDPTRGDQLSIQNIAFNERPADEPAEPGFFDEYGGHVEQGVRVLVILVVAAMAFFLVGRPLMRRVVVDARPVDDPDLPKQLPKTIEQIEGEIAAQLDAAAAQGDRRVPVMTRRLAGLTQKDPEVAARLVRTWLLEDKK
jgi:flagellar M-ring protein FliF